MKYTVVNEELKIATCQIKDLTLNQIRQILERFGDDSEIGSLTLFLDEETGYIVINRDGILFEDIIKITEGYLVLNDEKRNLVRDEAPGSMRETMDILERTLQYRRCKMDIFRAKHNFLPSNEEIALLNQLSRTENNVMAVVYAAFQYGVMQGKRAERAKKIRDCT